MEFTIFHSHRRRRKHEYNTIYFIAGHEIHTGTLLIVSENK